MFKTVAIVGATGAVGNEFRALIAQRGWNAERYVMLASARSAGREVRLGDRGYVVQELIDSSFEGVELALFSAGGSTSQRFAPVAARAGAVVVDNSSAFRMEPEVPLVIPEINPQDAQDHRGIIANPNCSTIVLLMAVWPLHRVSRVRRIVVSTYQAVSGAGLRAMEELQRQTRDVLAGKTPRPEVFPHPCAFNLFSHNSPIDATGYNAEERKMVHETHKILHDQAIAVTATCVRVPVLRAHSEAVNLTFEKPMTARQAREILSAAPGVRVVDQLDPPHFPMPIEATGIDEVLVGRIRQDISQPDGRGIDLFISGDQLRKGAALNAIQIAELLRPGGV